LAHGWTLVRVHRGKLASGDMTKNVGIWSHIDGHISNSSLEM